MISFTIPSKENRWSCIFFRSRAVLFWDIFGRVSEFDPHLHWRSKIFKGYLLTNLGYVLPRQIAWQWLTRKFKTNKLFRGYLFEGFSPYMFDSPICSKFHAKHINPSSSPLVTASSFANQKGHQVFVSLNPKYPVSEVHRAFLAETKRQDSLNEIRWKSGISIIYACTWCQIPNSKSMVFFLVTPQKKNYMRWLNDLLNLRNLIEQYQTYAPVVKLNLDHLPQGYQGKRYHQKKIFQQKQPPQEIQ